MHILEKDTRATAISFGFPTAVTRSHPDFPALSVARAALGEHRMTTGRLFQRIREVRGMNYGDYAYLEAFPGGMFTFFPSPNLARQAQIFEIWIRPVVPANAHIVRYEVGSKSDIKAGAPFSILAAAKQPDGTFTAPRINVGKDGGAPF